MRRKLSDIKRDLRSALSMYGTAVATGDRATMNYLETWVRQCEAELTFARYGRTDVRAPQEA